MSVLQCWMLLIPLAAQEPAAMPTVLLLPVQSRGISPDTSALLSELASARLQASRRFSRVASTADLQAALSLEQQKQLMDCGSESCTAELANSLKVDLVMLGTAGRVGSVVTLSFKMLDARRNAIVASATRTLTGEDDGKLLLEVDGLVDELLRAPELGLTPRPQEAVAAAPAPPAPAPPQEALPQATEEEPQRARLWLYPGAAASAGYALLGLLTGGCSLSVASALAAALFIPLAGSGIFFCVSVPLGLLMVVAAVVTGALYVGELVSVVVWRRSTFDSTDRKVTAAFGGLLAGGGLLSLLSCLAGCGLCCGGFAAFVSGTPASASSDISGGTAQYNPTQRAGLTVIMLSLGAGAMGLMGGIWTALSGATLGAAAGVGMLKVGDPDDELAE